MTAGRIAQKPKVRCVLFKLQRACVRHVSLVGTFNGWNPTATPMCPAGRGQWARALFLPPGCYEFSLIVDGQFFGDPEATAATASRARGVNFMMVV